MKDKSMVNNFLFVRKINIKKVLYGLLFIFSWTTPEAQVSHSTADSLYAAGRYEEALGEYKKQRSAALLIAKDSVLMWDWFIFRVKNRLGDYKVLKELEQYVQKNGVTRKKDVYYLKILDELSYAYMNQRMATKAIDINRDILNKYKSWKINNPVMYSNALKSISFSFNILGDLDSSEHYIRKNLNFLEKNMKPDDVEVGYAHYYMGITQEEKLNTKAALENLLKAKNIVSAKNGEDHPHIGTIHDALARCYEAEGRYDDAENAYQNGIRIFKKQGLENSLVMTYINLSRLESTLGKNGNSKVYLEEARRLSIKNDRYVFPIKAYILKGLASYEMNHLGDYKSGIKLLKEALEDQIKNDDEGTALAHSFYAVAYAKNLDKDTVDIFYYLDKAREMYERYEKVTPHNYINVINDYGTAWFNRKKYAKALEFYYKSLDMYLKTLGESHVHVSETYSLIANCYREMNDHQKADSVVLVGSRYLFEKGYRQNANFPLTHLDLFQSRLQIEFNKAKEEKDYLLLFDRAANISYASVFKRSGMVNTEDLRLYRNSVDRLNLLLLEHAQKAFAAFNKDIFFEKFADFANTYKSNLISNKINEEKLLVASGIDNTSIKQYKSIREKARHLELLSAESNVSQIDSINQEKTRIHAAITAWQAGVEKKFNINLGQLIEPKYKSGAGSLEKYLCKEKSLILMYVADDNNYFVYTIGCQKIDKKIIGSKDMINRQIQVYLQLVQTLQNHKTVLQKSYELFNLLLGDINIRSCKNLIILQEGQLNALNFEMLVKTPPNPEKNYQNADWLFRTHEIMYAQYLPELSSRKATSFTGKNMLVITPDFTMVSGEEKKKTLGFPLTSTPWTSELCRFLQDRYSATLLAGEEARLTNWEKHKNNFDFIHIGTHAVMDPDQPLSSRLLLDGDKNDIDFYHILQSKIQAELVVLGACETGIGKDNGANDIYSLAQAFQYSGVKSIIQSLWKIDDETSNEIFKNFYAYRKSGFESPAALRMAKLDFLATHEGEKLNPYYWAGLVYISNEVYDEPNTIIWWVGSVLLASSIGYFIYYKKTSKN